MQVEFGLDTFGDVTEAPDGSPKSFGEVLRDVVEQGVLADQVGLHAIGVGEHHRRDFAISAPEVMLAAIAARTSQIRLGSAVTVLSSDDPIRVYERFATHQQPVSWSGRTRAPLQDQHVSPTIVKPPLPTWVGVGGSPESVVRTARHGLPMMLAIIGGDPLRFAPYAELYREALQEFGKPELPVGVHAPGHVADSDEQALDELWPAYSAVMGRIGRERGWPPMSPAEFGQQTGPRGAIFAGSPESVARKIAAVVSGLGLARFDLKFSHGTLAHPKLLRSIALYGARVVPRVRELLAEGV